MVERTHTILLVQPQPQASSRTYYDFETTAAAMDHIANLFEQQLQRENPRLAHMQYRAEDLFQFIDKFQEFVALVFDPAQMSYLPRDKEWIKDRLISHFSQPARSSAQQSNSHYPQQQYRSGRPSGGRGGRRY